jgi:hypothetical protein
MLVLKNLRTVGYPLLVLTNWVLLYILISSFNNSSGFLKKIKIKGQLIQSF